MVPKEARVEGIIWNSENTGRQDVISNNASNCYRAQLFESIDQSNYMLHLDLGKIAKRDGKILLNGLEDDIAPVQFQNL